MGQRSKSKKRQKSRTVFEHQVKPGLPKYAERLAALRTTLFPQVLDPRAEAALKKTKGGVSRLQARLHDPTVKASSGLYLETLIKKKTDTVARRPPNGYYVIIGCGAAAVVDHTTLRQSEAGREHLEALPVVHLGFDDPWLHYHPHGMGQPPYLLRMPGYHRPVDLDPNSPNTIRSGMTSTRFAAGTKYELDLLMSKFETYRIQAWAAAIESRTKPYEQREKLKELGLKATDVDNMLDRPFPEAFPKYRLLVVRPDASLHFLYAFKIDICSGAGQTAVRDFRGGADNHLLKPARTKPWLPSYKWSTELRDRKVIHGTDGLTVQTNWKANSRICVYGRGGIALNQIERAEDNPTVLVDWLSRSPLHQTFNLRRNDTVLKHPTEDRAMHPGEFDANRLTSTRQDETLDLFPARDIWRFGKGSTAASAVEAPPVHQTVLVKVSGAGKIGYSDRTYSDSVDSTFHYFPYKANSPGAVPAELKSLPTREKAKEYDRVILCGGQFNDVPGQPSALAGHFAFTPIVFHDRMVGLKCPGGDIRVLGAAAAMFPDVGDTVTGKKMETFRMGLPASAVPPGFILSAVNIASANGFFDDNVNTNVNSVSQEELEALLTSAVEAHQARTIAAGIVRMRQWPDNGFSMIEGGKRGSGSLWNRILDSDLVFLDANWDRVLAKLTIDYREADDWSAIRRPEI